MVDSLPPRPRTVIVGGGFTGLAAALDLAKAGHHVTVLEATADVGGLAGGFPVGETRLEKFYHHWFTNDRYVIDLVRELGLSDRIILRETRTGMYYANRIFRLSNPLDVLRFSPLPFFDRVRLGLQALQARRVTDWRALEALTAKEWLIRSGGRKTYAVVWEPLLKGKFGRYADEISAVWFWSKLCLRGGSRGSGGKEMLAYFRGGFIALAEAVAERVRSYGGEFRMNTPATGIRVADGRIVAVETPAGPVACDTALLTTALPLAADLLEGHAPAEYLAQLRKIRYLANICLVLQLDRSLSSTYWLNVTDPSFPYVGIIEHTNFEPAASYGSRHIVYLSKYLPSDDAMYGMSEDDLVDFSIPHIQRMFPEFRRDWITEARIWRADHAQPIIERWYSRMLPAAETPIDGLFLASMAQVYPEDRGTNYAIREGRRIAERIATPPRFKYDALRADGQPVVV